MSRTVGSVTKLTDIVTRSRESTSLIAIILTQVYIIIADACYQTPIILITDILIDTFLNIYVTALSLIVFSEKILYRLIPIISFHKATVISIVLFDTKTGHTGRRKYLLPANMSGMTNFESIKNGFQTNIYLIRLKISLTGYRVSFKTSAST